AVPVLCAARRRSGIALDAEERALLATFVGVLPFVLLSYPHIRYLARYYPLFLLLVLRSAERLARSGAGPRPRAAALVPVPAGPRRPGRAARLRGAARGGLARGARRARTVLVQRLSTPRAAQSPGPSGRYAGDDRRAARRGEARERSRIAGARRGGKAPRRVR